MVRLVNSVHGLSPPLLAKLFGVCLQWLGVGTKGCHRKRARVDCMFVIKSMENANDFLSRICAHATNLEFPSRVVVPMIQLTLPESEE